jgi:chaperonin GroEL
MQQFLKDIALATGGTMIDSELGMMLQTVTADQLGHAISSTTTRSLTTIRTSDELKPTIDDHVARLKRELAEADNIYDEQKLQYRIAAMSGGVASIKVGAATETELKDKKLR